MDPGDPPQKVWSMFGCRSVAVAVTIALIGSAASKAAEPLSTAGTKPEASGGGFFTLPPGDRPLIVRAGFELLDVTSIDEEAATFEFSGVLMLSWRDTRLAFDPERTGVSEKVFQGRYQILELSPAWFPQVALTNGAGTFDRLASMLRIRPDGQCVLSELIQAEVSASFALRRMPFDSQELVGNFQLFGFDTSELAVELVPDQRMSPDFQVSVPQWDLRGYACSVLNIAAPFSMDGKQSSVMQMKINVKRQPLFVLRLVMMPVALIVIISWSIFWINHAPLGDRVSISFVGVLTAVSFQVVLKDLMPQVSSQTFLNAFVNISFWMTCASVVTVLVIGSLEESGANVRAKQLGHRCRWLFPLAYFVLIAISWLMSLSMS